MAARSYPHLRRPGRGRGLARRRVSRRAAVCCPGLFWVALYFDEGDGLHGSFNATLGRALRHRGLAGGVLLGWLSRFSVVSLCCFARRLLGRLLSPPPLAPVFGVGRWNRRR